MANDIVVTLPSLGWDVNRFEVVLPSFESDFGYEGGGSIDVILPRLDSSVNVATGETGSINIILDWPYLQSNNGKISFSLYGGGGIDITLPTPTVNYQAVAGGLYSLNVVLPLVSALLGSQFADGVGSIDVNLPLLTMGGTWHPHIIGSIAGAIPLMRMYATSKTGAVGQIDAELPLIEYSGVMYANGVGSIDVTLPIMIVDKYGTSTPSTISYKAIIMNTKNFGVSEYPGYEFNSMVNFNGKLLGSKGSTIHLVGAQNDSGENIDMSIRTGNLNFNNPVVMLPRDVWITLRSGKKVAMKVLEADKSDDYIYEYTSDDFVENLKNTRVKLGRGLRGAAVRFEIDNQDGEELEIERIHILSSPLPGKKR